MNEFSQALNSELLAAAGKGDVSKVDSLLTRGANKEAKNTVSVVTSGVLSGVNEVNRVVFDDDGDE